MANNSKYKYTVSDGSGKDPREIFDLLMFYFQVNGGGNKLDYYCGVATVPENRFSDHERDHWAIDKILLVVDCGPDSKEKAVAVETLMHEKGFDCGAAPGRGADEGTRFVYFVQKGKPVKREIDEGELRRKLRDLLRGG